MFQLLGRAFTASFLAVFSLSTSPANASNILIFADQLQLDLTKSQNMYDYAVARCIHRSLVRRDPVGHLRADAAQSWKVSKDRTQYDFELAPLQFHNGAHLNSTIAVDSLKASFRGQSDIARLVSPHIEKVEAIDGNHVRITLYKPYEPLMKALSTADFVIKMASKEQNSDLVGLGPYRASLVDRHLSLRNIADNTDLNIAYSRDVRVLKKALTYVDAAFGIPNRIALEPIEGMNSKLKIHFVNNLSFSHYLINPNRPFSKDKARRQMLRQSIMQSLSLQREKWMEQFGALTSILPLGVLNRTAEKPFPSLPVDKWKGELRIHFPKGWWPDEFAQLLKDNMSKIASKVTIVESNKKSDINFSDLDLIASDYILPYDEPDISIPIFDLQAFGVKNGPAFVNLKRDVDSFSSYEGSGRISAFSKRLYRYVEEGWSIPLFSQKVAVFVSEEMKLGEVAFQFENILCH